MSSVVKDIETTDLGGKAKIKLPEGVTMQDVTTHVDERGTVFEVYNPNWGWHKVPIVFGHIFTVRPGYVKGWGMHKLHEDRYCLLFGEMDLVLYDDRPKSPTRGLISVIQMNEFHRKLVNIPPGIWHAGKNIGSKDVVVLDTPTKPYDHKNPDKYRLPLNTKKIPFSFEGFRGW